MNKPTALNELSEIQANNYEGINIFMKKYAKIVDISLAAILKKIEKSANFFGIQVDNELIEALRHEGFVGFFFALQNFDKEKSKDDNSLYDLLFKYSYGFMMDYLNELVKEDETEIKFEDIYVDEHMQSPEEILNFSDTTSEIQRLLNKREAELFNFSLEGLSFREMANEIGVSSSRIGHNISAMSRKVVMVFEDIYGRNFDHLREIERTEAQQAYFVRRNEAYIKGKI